MSTQPKHSQMYDLQDWRHVRARVSTRYAAIEQYDLHRKIKALDAGRLAQIDARASAAEQALGHQSVTKTEVHAATHDQAHLRGVLFDLCTSIRDDVKLAFERTEPITARAFGMGIRIKQTATHSLLTMAQAQISAFANPSFGASAQRCGVTAARIAELEETATALSDAQANQSVSVSKRIGKTITKKQLFAALRRDTTYMRKVWRRVFRGQPAILLEIESKVPRYTPVPRVKDEGEEPTLPLELETEKKPATGKKSRPKPRRRKRRRVA